MPYLTHAAIMAAYEEQPQGSHRLTLPPRSSRSRLMLLARLFGGPTHLVLKRVRHLVGVTVLAVLGIVLSVGLISSAGFFAQGVDQAILVTELAEFTRVTGRDPFLTRVYIFPAEYSPIPLERAESLRDLVAGILAREVGLPPKDVRLAVSTGRVQLRPPPDLPLYAPDHTFPMVTLGYTADIAGHMETVLGEPLDGDPSDGSLDVWMHVALADRMGVQIGDRFVIELGEDRQGVPLGVRGVWAPRDPENPFWYGDPRTDMIDVLLVRRQDYVARLEPLIPAGTRYVTWDITLDERAVESARVSDYVSGFERSLIVLQRYLPEARLVTPDNPLRSFVRRQTALTTLLLGFGVPSFIFLLGFLALMSTIIVRWRQRETAILVSRGVSRLTIVYLTLLEELVLFVVGTPLGLGLGMLLARWMARCGSFLSFTSDRAIPISLRGANGYLIAAALGVALVARLWPSAQAARRSVVQEEREYSRPLRPPFWYRHYLDLLLVLPTWYAYRQLAQRGTLAVLVRDRPQDLYQDPMLILAPALLIFVASLLAMRLFPLIMRAVDLIAGLAPWTVPHLALRQLGRHSQSYISPLLLVIVSLSMGIYTLSMARSLDQWLLDRLYYRVGADASFQPFRLAEDGGDASPTADWIPPPEEFLRIPGV
ncbi:MAG: FtsX-like permease family protein, partial [Chloroflexi bacterium]|nr:FtsX-like permease family protein [Chloroflexota bacterium]